MPKYVTAIVVLLAAGGSLYALRGQQPASRPAAAPPERAFTGKVLVIHLKSDSEATLTIENPAVSRLGDRAFLVGLCIGGGDEDEEDWRDGLTVWTAMDDISQIVELRDRDELKQRMQAAPEKDRRPTRA